jgi:8-oxo-dGTP diphosphatase
VLDTVRVIVVGAAIVDGRRALVARRGGTGPLSGLWEFPGGKVLPEESLAAALVRECQEELGVLVRVGSALGSPTATADGGGVLHVFTAEIVAGEPAAIEHSELRWVAAGELGELAWIPADRPIVAALRALLSA